MAGLLVESGDSPTNDPSEPSKCMIHIHHDSTQPITLSVDTDPVEEKVWRRSQLLMNIVKHRMKDDHVRVKMPFSRTAVLQWATLEPCGAPTDAVWLCNTLDVRSATTLPLFVPSNVAAIIFASCIYSVPVVERNRAREAATMARMNPSAACTVWRCKDA